MRGTRLGIAPVGFHLDRMNQVWKLDGILDKEDGNVVADEVEISFLGVKLYGEASHIPGQVHRTRASRHG